MAFVRDTYRGALEPDPAQIAILEAVRDYDRVAVRTGRGIGKTSVASFGVIPWFLTTHFPALVVTSAGTWNHLSDKLWPEIRMWGRKWELRDYWEYQDLGMYHREHPDEWRVVAASSDKAENVEGYHSPNLLLLIDEGKAMPDELFAALLASLTGESSGGVQKVLALSTPPLAKGGWFSRVSTSTDWKLVHVSGLDSPRVSRAYIEEIRHDYGEDSPEYQSYVLGEIPEVASGAVVPAAWFEAAQRMAPQANRRPPVITCDVAREGEDLTTFGEFKGGAFNLVWFAEERRWGWFSGADLMTTAGRCTTAVKQAGAKVLCIDDGGLGGGVTDRLREMQHEGRFPKSCQIKPIKFGMTAGRSDRFRQLKDELWWRTREAIREGLIAMPSDDVIRSWQTPRGSDFKTQVISAIYEPDSRELIDVFDKRVAGKEKTRSLPTKSPDLAHALILGVSTYLGLAELPVEMDPDMPGDAVLASWLDKAVAKTLRPPIQDPFRRAR